MTRQLKQDWVIFLLIAVVAIVLRVYAIDRLPPGLFGDEAVEGLDALDVLAGNFQIWFHAHLGREPIYVYLVALSYAMFGVTPLATRLPAIIAGLVTIPATYWLVREWSAQIFSRERAHRLALLTTILVTISFWHIQMTRNAHRDTLLPLVEAIGYAMWWRAFRTRDWKMYAAAGAVLGLAIYTYSPGRFVGVFVALFVIIEFLAWHFFDRRPKTEDGKISIIGHRSSVIGLALTGLLAIIIMLPLILYFAQNPAQFSRRFDSTSIFEQASPTLALIESVTGNLAQFVVPNAGYQSKHYNLPGKPVFDLFIAPWFIAGGVIALARLRQAQYRFLLLWFIVMCVPAFLTADMIPKGVRVFGIVPGVFIFPALAMDGLIERATGGALHEAITTTNRARLNRMELALPNPFAMAMVFGLIVLSLVASALWTTHDYFIAWANLPELPLAFDADQTKVAEFIQRQSPMQSIHISYEVYRAPTLMLLGERVPTSRYIERATRFKEFDARTMLIANPNALHLFIRDRVPPDDWLARVAPQATRVEQGEYFIAYRLNQLAPPKQMLNIEFNPLLKIVGVARFDDGIVLYWQVAALPNDRQEIDTTLVLIDAGGKLVTQDKQRFGAPPLEWAIGDVIVEWYAREIPVHATHFSIEMTRGASMWRSPLVPLR
jgi:4-amino-4-deoxy-L-arabinose transferase-like glycosyltransferase